MSEPIQSISQGNYILATQQEVSHDNSLSGNGTVDSPLGVVPGYNETVLWSGDASPQFSNTTGAWSEPLSNFERVRMYWSNNDAGSYKCTEYPTEYGLTYLGDCSPNGQWWKGITVVVNNTGFSDIKCWELTNGSPSTAAQVNYFHFMKLVGINRK